MSLPSTPFDFASNRRKLTSLPRPQYSPFPTSLRPSQLSLPSISYNSPQTSNLISSFTPNGSKSVPPPRRNQQNPFDQLSAGEFESFVDGVKRKIREALDPVITPQNKAEEQTEDASVDVFGQIKGLREEIMSDDVIMDSEHTSPLQNGCYAPHEMESKSGPEEITIDDSSSELEYAEELVEEVNILEESQDEEEKTSEAELDELELQEQDDYLDDREEDDGEDVTLLTAEAEAEWGMEEEDEPSDTIKKFGGFISASRHLAESSPPAEEEFDTDTQDVEEDVQEFESDSDEGDLTMDQLFPPRTSTEQDYDAFAIDEVENRIPSHLKGKGRATGPASVSPSRSIRSSSSSSITSDGSDDAFSPAHLRRYNSTNLLKYCEAIHDQLQEYEAGSVTYERTQNTLLMLESVYRWRMAAEEAGEDLSDNENDESEKEDATEDENVEPSTEGEASFEQEGEQEGQWSKNAVLSASAKRKAERARRSTEEKRRARSSSSIGIAEEFEREESAQLSEMEQNSPPLNDFTFSPGQDRHTEAVATQLVDMHTAGLEPHLAVPILDFEEDPEFSYLEEPDSAFAQEPVEDGLAQFLVELSSSGQLDRTVPVGIQVLEDQRLEDRDVEALQVDHEENLNEEEQDDEDELAPAPLGAITLSSSPEGSPTPVKLAIREESPAVRQESQVYPASPEFEEEEEEGVDENIAPEFDSTQLQSSPAIDADDEATGDEDIEMIEEPRQSSYEIRADSIISEPIDYESTPEVEAAIPVTRGLVTALSSMAQQISALKAESQAVDYTEDESDSEDDDVEIMEEPESEIQELDATPDVEIQSEAEESNFESIDMSFTPADMFVPTPIAAQPIGDSVFDTVSVPSIYPSLPPVASTSSLIPRIDPRMTSSVIDFSLGTTTPVSEAESPTFSSFALPTVPSTYFVEHAPDLNFEPLDALLQVASMYPAVPLLDMPSFSFPTESATTDSALPIPLAGLTDDSSTIALLDMSGMGSIGPEIVENEIIMEPASTVDDFLVPPVESEPIIDSLLSPPAAVEVEVEEIQAIENPTLETIIDSPIAPFFAPPSSEVLIEELVVDETIPPTAILEVIEQKEVLPSLESTLEVSPTISRTELLDDDDFPALSEGEESFGGGEEEDEVEIVEIGSPLMDDDFANEEPIVHFEDLGEDLGVGEGGQSAEVEVMEENIEISILESFESVDMEQVIDMAIELPSSPPYESAGSPSIEIVEGVEIDEEIVEAVVIESTPDDREESFGIIEDLPAIEITVEEEEVQVIETTQSVIVVEGELDGQDSVIIEDPIIEEPVMEESIEIRDSSEDELTLMPSIRSEVSRKLHSPSVEPSVSSIFVSPALQIRPNQRTTIPAPSPLGSVEVVAPIESKKRPASSLADSPKSTRRLRSASPFKVDSSALPIRQATPEIESEAPPESPGSTRRLRSASPFVVAATTPPVPLVVVENLEIESISTPVVSTRILRSASPSKTDLPTTAAATTRNVTPEIESNQLLASPQSTRRLRSASPFIPAPSLDMIPVIDESRPVIIPSPRSNTKRNRPSDASVVSETSGTSKKQKKKDEKKEKRDAKESTKKRNIKL